MRTRRKRRGSASDKAYIKVIVLVFSMLIPFFTADLLKQQESAATVCWGSLVACLITIVVMIVCILNAVFNDSQVFITSLSGAILSGILAIVFVPYVEDLSAALSSHYTVAVGTVKEVYISGRGGGYRNSITTKDGVFTQKMNRFEIGDKVKVEYLPHSHLVNRVTELG